jgi:hypothetical protein
MSGVHSIRLSRISPKSLIHEMRELGIKLTAHLDVDRIGVDRLPHVSPAQLIGLFSPRVHVLEVAMRAVLLALSLEVLISMSALAQSGRIASAPQTSGLNFAPAVTYSSGGGNAVSVAIADVNGDGIPDLVIANGCANNTCDTADGSVSVLLGNGNGTFQTAVRYDSGGYLTDGVAVADVNGDGKPDIVLANYCADHPVGQGFCLGDGNGSVGVLLGNGDGTFQPVVGYDSGGYGTTSVAIADVNGDGIPDVVLANQCVTNSNCDNGTVGVLLGNGDGTLQTVVTYNSGGYGAYSVAVADVSGDGNADILVSNNSAGSGDSRNGSVGVLLGNGDGTFQTVVTYNSGGYVAYSIAVADVNGDGKLDVVVANQCQTSFNCDGTVGVLLGNGNGTFRKAATFGSGGYNADGVAVADLNGDGNLDLVVTNNCGESQCGSNSTGTVGVLLGNGHGAFQKAVTYDSGGQNAESVAAADLNGDGNLDLVVGSNAVSTNTAQGGVLNNTSGKK